jgi:hypothetical protein
MGWAPLTGQALKQILAHLERKAESKEFNLLPESRAPPQEDLSGSQRDQFASVNSPNSSEQKKAASSRHAWWLNFCRIGRRQGAPKVGALGDFARVDGNQSDYGCPRAGLRRESLFFILVE